MAGGTSAAQAGHGGPHPQDGGLPSSWGADKAAGGARSEIGSLERLLCSEQTALQRSKAKGSWEAERHKQVMAAMGEC